MELNIEKFFAALPDAKRELALKVREIILKADDSIKEDIKWGNLTFVSNGNIAFIYTYKSVPYINLGYMRAVELTDPKGLLEGTGKGMRHIKIASTKDIDKKQITLWTKEAVMLSGMSKAKPTKKPLAAKKTSTKKPAQKRDISHKGAAKKTKLAAKKK